MTLWSRIANALSSLAKGESLSNVFEKLKTPPERTVAFAIAIIALSAKMAKADGQVTRDEVSAFKEVFNIPKRNERQAAKVFNLARQDVAGFESYATKISTMFQNDYQSLSDLLEGLFHIALSDGNYHPAENEFLEKVSKIFNISEISFLRIRSRFVPNAPKDPYNILGVDPDMPIEEIRQSWRKLVRTTHPDQMIARGVPEEAIRIATKQLTDINNAWEKINQEIV